VYARRDRPVTRTASPNRAALLRRNRELVLDALPRRARKAHWIVIHDHCFGRVVLDDTVGGCWYDVLDRRRSPAFAQLDDEQVSNAVALAERIAAEGDPLLPDRDARSLAWRGMAPKPGRGRSPGDGEAGPLALNALVKGCVTIFGTHTV
jgi:hypothetical protein